MVEKGEHCNKLTEHQRRVFLEAGVSEVEGVRPLKETLSSMGY